MKACINLIFALTLFVVDGLVPANVGRPSFLRQQQDSRALFASSYDYALLFDCDGVILETEELHRLAYNAAFDAAGLTIDGSPVVWSVEYYDVLQNTIGGGKPKMFFHFRNTTRQFPMVGDKPAPATPEEQQELIDNIVMKHSIITVQEFRPISTFVRCCGVEY